MPIKPENKSRYPADWPAIRLRILQRAGYRCEHPGCNARQYSVGWWSLDDRGWRWNAACGQPATIQCDAPTKRRSGTCDRHLCANCATEVGPDRHVCRERATSGFSTADEASEAPRQQGLF